MSLLLVVLFTGASSDRAAGIRLVAVVPVQATLRSRKVPADRERLPSLRVWLPMFPGRRARFAWVDMAWREAAWARVETPSFARTADT